MVVLVALVALLHPGGLPGLLSITADGAVVTIDWSAPPDDIAVISDTVGGAAGVADYVLARLEVSHDGRPCDGSIAVDRGDAVTFEFDCGAPVGAVTVRSTILTDIDPAYQTLAVAPVREGPDRVLFTGARNEETFVLGEAGAGGAVARVPDVPGLRLAFEDRLLGVVESGGGALGLLAIGVALLVGAAHAMAPGHGKSLAAAYLVGSRGRPRDALILGVTVAGMHTVSVLVVGLLVYLTTRTVEVSRTLPWIAVAAGVAVTALGVWMVVRRLRGTTHDHGVGHTHDHAEPVHRHGTADAVTDDAGRPSRGWLALVGASGGLLPSPSALVALLAAIGVGRIVLGLALIAAFSVGLAAAVTVVGLAAIRGRDLIRHRPRFASWLPLAGSVGVVLAGIYLTTQALLAAV